MTGTAALVNPLDIFSTPLGSVASPGFELLIFATNWGFNGSWDQFCSKIKTDGYDGAEVWYPTEDKSRKEFLEAIKKYNLKFAFLFGGSDSKYEEHLKQFKATVEQAVTFNPVFINSHSGKDHFTFEQNSAFFEFTNSFSVTSGIPIYHETHRGRILYSAPVARQFIEKHASLRLTLDISHWCNVHESLLSDQPETIKLALSRTDHIHTRVGHAEGPQVNDPRAPEWTDAVNAHFTWWDNVVTRKRSEGKRLTMLTEFGPVDYLPALPFTRQPVADQWEINKHMLNTLRSRYAG
jgi:sugar phosphate isomerase/epimerase